MLTSAAYLHIFRALCLHFKITLHNGSVEKGLLRKGESIYHFRASWNEDNNLT